MLAVWGVGLEIGPKICCYDDSIYWLLTAPMVCYKFSTVQEVAAAALRNNSKLKEKWTKERTEMKGNNLFKNQLYVLFSAGGSRSRHTDAWVTPWPVSPTPAGQLQGLCAPLGETRATHPLTPKSASSLATALCLARSGVTVGPPAWPQSRRHSAGSWEDVVYLRPYSQEAAFNSGRH